MAEWKKVIVSGSAAELADLKVDSLVSGSVVIGGGSDGNLSSTPINGSGDILATTGATNVVMTGSFTGSFVGDGSQLTGVVATDLSHSLSEGTGITAFTFDGSTGGVVVEVSGSDTLSTDTVTKWTGDAFADTNITDDGTAVTIDSNTIVSGSLTVTGSQVYLTTDDFRVTSPSGTDLLVIDGIGNVDVYDISGTSAASINARRLSDSAGGLSVDWENRQLIKSDSSLSVDWENGLFSGSFSGSFEGDGTNLTGVVSASYANNATSASYANNASTADSATSASYANNASTADSATSASYALNASTADSATSASYALNASTADSATSASYATTATSASHALTASYVNTLNQDVLITGSLTVLQGATIYGSTSFQYVTASQLDVSASFISVNVFEPLERFGGLKVYDSGSSTATASLAWDSLNNHWVYQNASGSSYNGAMFIAGPKNTGSLGDEQGLTQYFVPVAQGEDHIQDSTIFNSGSITQITGSLTVTAGVSGSFSGSFEGDGAGLTNIPAGAITGLNLSAIATGSVTASVDVATNSFPIVSGSTTLFNVRQNGGLEHGSNVTASGNWSHAEGNQTTASGTYSHAEGYQTTASGNYSHAEGVSTIASGPYSHTEGNTTIASGPYSHTEGNSTTASGYASHAEGYQTTASGNYSHAEGTYSTASGYGSHAEGANTTASGYYSHAEGQGTVASGNGAHAEGAYTIASGLLSHAEGKLTTASGNYSHAEGFSTTASGNYSHAEGQSTIASGSYSHAEGYLTIASGSYSHAEGQGTTASGDYSHAEGLNTIASGSYSHAEGSNTIASGDYSHAEGNQTIASGNCSHAEGNSTTASGLYSHAEGTYSTASGYGSHAEGNNTVASGSDSHAEGTNTTAIGGASHAEGNSTTASGNYSHAEGFGAIASGSYSHAEGIGTIASGSGQLAAGKYNTHGNDTSLVVIGNGVDDSTRSDLAKFNTSDIQFSSSLYVTGSTVSLVTDAFEVKLGYDTNAAILSIDTANGVYINSTNGSSSLDANTRELFDSNAYVSVNWTDRQLIKSDGTTVTVDWENGTFTGSFTGSFVGDGSQLTGVVATDLAYALTGSTGIEYFTFDGSSAVSVAVSGAAALTSNTITKWTGDAFADTNITDDGSLVTVAVNTLFQGDITVQGTASFQSTENLLVSDRFVLFASGSNTAGDGGIVVQQGVQNFGELYGFNNSAARWGFTSSFDATATSFTPDAYIAAVVDVDGGQTMVPRYEKNGNIKVEGGDIYIYA